MHFFRSKLVDLLLVISSHLLLFFSYSSNASTFSGLYCQSNDPSSTTTFQANLNSLLQSLISNTPSSSGFYKTSIGENPNRIYGLAMCRADIGSDECENCLRGATNDVVQNCISKSVGIVYYDHCMLRFKNDNFFGRIDTSNDVQNISTQDFSDVDPRKLINRLVNIAPSKPLMFAADKFQVHGFSETRYGLVQCTRDLSGVDCGTCLAQLMNDEYEKCCVGMREWRIFAASCNVGYDDLPFFSDGLESAVPAPQPSAALHDVGNATIPPPTPGPQQKPIQEPVSEGGPQQKPIQEPVSEGGPQQKPIQAPVSEGGPQQKPIQVPVSEGPKPNIPRKKSVPSSKVIIIGVVVIVVALIFILAIICYYPSWRLSSNNHIFFWKKNRTENLPDIEMLSLTPIQYRYSDLKKMTQNFSEKLGQGGYGNVFKGKLPNGRLVAVKILNKSKGNGEEFSNEVATIGKTHHVNVVPLVGFSHNKRSKRALIYEYMPKGSLEKLIFNKQSTPSLGWEKLYQIALGIAKGLNYLHHECTPRILHFDIKPENILLDEEFCPKISDFGLARLCERNKSTISMLDARGTPGYTAPEVLLCTNLRGVSHKSDVFSYGMVVLEMVGGRKNLDTEGKKLSEIYFPHWIHKHLEKQGDEWKALLGEFAGAEEEEIARKMSLVGLCCIQKDPKDRPAMSKVVEMLEGIVELQMPPTP